MNLWGIITIAAGLGRDQCRLSWRWDARRRNPLPICQFRCPNRARGSACPAARWAVQGQAFRQMSSQRCDVGGLQKGGQNVSIALPGDFGDQTDGKHDTNQGVPIRTRHRGKNILELENKDSD